MATSQVSISLVRAWLRRGLPLPPAWGVYADGTDAAGANSIDEIAALQALGGYKGHGLAMAIAVVCALMADMPLDHELSHFYTPPFDSPRQVSHFVVAIDVASFVAPDTFRRRLTDYLRYVRSQPAVPGGCVRAPGDLEQIAYADRCQNGIPLTREEFDQFRAIGLETEV
jgi:LDH2 family malate/lactate/ureidoglycolate dehydrogenase